MFERFILAVAMLFGKVRAAVKFYDPGGAKGFIKAIMGAAIIVVVGAVVEDKVLPAVINSDPGTLGATVLPLLQTGILIGCIFAAIGVIYYAATSMITTK